jgi:hypothetical protein
MNTAVAPQKPAAEIVDDVIARGDLKNLTPQQRVVHYHRVCDSLGLNPATQPFQYITLNGKLQLYARKDATDQLRKINGVSLAVVSQVLDRDGLFTVTARATDKTGRTDEDIGVVALAGLRGETASNTRMKAVTKAKRRVTLSICGLGFSDESEIESIPGAEIVSIDEAHAGHDPETGEVHDRPPPETENDYARRWKEILEHSKDDVELEEQWDREHDLRQQIKWGDPQRPARIETAVVARRKQLKSMQEQHEADLQTKRLEAQDQ